ncbi:hypothetical protein LCGC14_0465790 [marine sediment metagenome]|uniref:Uncharacterized protein n=1 Tax=marine sediment metagenome TaxID=412755 RepID=A0A0F9SDT7_9ZZZZ
MKPRKIYYSRKNKRIVIEGKRKNKTIYLFTLPEPMKLLESLKLPSEKMQKIMEKISRLDYKEMGGVAVQ